MRILAELTTGTQTGKLCADAMRPPLLADFEKQCGQFGLKIHSTAEQQLTLEIFAKRSIASEPFPVSDEISGLRLCQTKKGI